MITVKRSFTYYIIRILLILDPNPPSLVIILSPILLLPCQHLRDHPSPRPYFHNSFSLLFPSPGSPIRCPYFWPYFTFAFSQLFTCGLLLFFPLYIWMKFHHCFQGDNHPWCSRFQSNLNCQKFPQKPPALLNSL